MRRPNDSYPTPSSIAIELVYRWTLPTMTVWEPCAGEGHLSEVLKKRVNKVISTDITRHEDFFEYTSPLAEIVVTNPPFKPIRSFIDHAFDIGVKKMALVCPERLWACRKGRDQFLRHRPSRWVNLDWREDYLQKNKAPDRALAIAIWECANADACVYEVWTRAYKEILPPVWPKSYAARS